MTEIDRTTGFGSFELTRPRALGMAALLLATIIAYLPAIHAGFIWDDDSYVTENELLHDFEGLARIWIPSETPQYYPLVFSTFWIEYQLWELNPMGFHITNVLLHGLSALLLWIVMVRLCAPGAWLIAAVFALHPMMVESVAWITERKNVLSMFFYLLAALAYLRFDALRFERTELRSPGATDNALRSHALGWYAATLLLFLCALLSKTVTCSLPAALILIMLWLRIPISAKRLAPLIPLFIIGFILAMNTAYIEREYVGAIGEDFDFSFLDRCIIASKALLFYPWKMLWPAELMFIYPRWEIETSNPLQYLPLAACIAIGLACIIAFYRGWRGPFVALAFYAGTVFPAIGFFNVYPHLFSFVADHFVYHASIGFIAFIIGGLAHLVRNGLPLRIIAAVILPILFALTWMQSTKYDSEETLYRETIARNPDAWMPRNNLSSILLSGAEQAFAAGDRAAAHSLAQEAQHHAEEALRARPQHHTAHSNRSEALRLLGRYEDALDAITRAHEEAPHVTIYLWQQARLHELLDQTEQAIDAYRAAFEAIPGNRTIGRDLVRLLRTENKLDEAAAIARTMLEHHPNDAMLLASLAGMYRDQQRSSEADRYYRRAIDAAETTEEYVPIVTHAIRFWTQTADAEYRDLATARFHTEYLAELTGGRDPGVLTLRAIVAAAEGNMHEAQQFALHAIALARQYGMEAMAAQIERELRDILVHQ